MSSMPVPRDAATDSAVRRTATGWQSIPGQSAGGPLVLSSRSRGETVPENGEASRPGTIDHRGCAARSVALLCKASCVRLPRTETLSRRSSPRSRRRVPA